MPRHAMKLYALPCSSTPCHAVLYDASRTLSRSLGGNRSLANPGSQMSDEKKTGLTRDGM
eukprot:626110-Pyramimonas_sp.AAC.1